MAKFTLSIIWERLGNLKYEIIAAGIKGAVAAALNFL